MPRVFRNHFHKRSCVSLTIAALLAGCSGGPSDEQAAPAPGTPAPGTPAPESVTEMSETNDVEAPSGVFENGDPRQRPEFERIAQHLYQTDENYFGRGRADRIKRERLQAGGDRARVLNLSYNLVHQLLRDGRTEEAVAEADQVLELFRTMPYVLEAELSFQRMRALAYLRLAEVENCINRHNADCCLFPLKGGGVHSVKQPAVEARAMYLAYLEHRPDDLAMRWLLNITVMMVGDGPEGIPPEQRIGLDRMDSPVDVGRFTDIAPDLGIDTFNLCGGCIVDDFNNDGFLDIITSTIDPEGPLTFYVNRGDGTFQDRSAESLLDDQLGGLNIVGNDYDNDGDVDVLVLRGAWLFDTGRIRNSLLRNNADGTFTDVTRAAGLAEPAFPTQAAVWGDFDNDGDLDLYLANESRVDPGVFPAERAVNGDYPSQLFRNNGDGTFTDIADAAGVTNDRYGKGVTAGDYDNDGDLDLYVSNIGLNRLYRNNGDSTFTDVAPQLGVTQPDVRSFVSWFFDYDNDGWLDLFVAAYDARIADVAADYLGLANDATPPRLYHNNGDGTFTDVAPALGLDHPYLPMGANFGDLDNDGYIDMYLTTGDPSYETLMPNVMLRNDAGRGFQDVTQAGGFGHLQKGHGVAFADLDNDGDQDVYHQLGGFYPGDAFNNALFLNPGHEAHFLVIQLVGIQSNRQGYGARIDIEVESAGGTRHIRRAVGSVSSFGGSPHRQEIGLGDATAILKLTIDWPASGIRQVFDDVTLDFADRSDGR